MTNAPPGREARRAQLAALIAGHVPDVETQLTDDLPLITSGRLESLGLLEVALWVESQIDPTVELGAFDLAAEWDTVGSILDFVDAHACAGVSRPETTA